jgi:hypothetical protein
MICGVSALGITNAVDKNAPRVTAFLLRTIPNAIQEGATKAMQLLKPVAQNLFSPAKLKKAAPFALAGFAISALYYGARHAYLDTPATPDEGETTPETSPEARDTNESTDNLASDASLNADA